MQLLNNFNLEYYFDFEQLALYQSLPNTPQIRVEFKVKCTESERVAIQEFLNSDPNPKKRNLLVTKNALLMLKKRLLILIDFISKNEVDYEINMMVDEIMERLKMLPRIEVEQDLTGMVDMIARVNNMCQVYMNVMDKTRVLH